MIRGVRFFLVEPKGCFHAGDFVARRGAIASIYRRPASLDLGLAFRWPISRARRQMRGDRIKCLGLRTYRTSCINATDSICRRARTESQSVVKLGQWARVDDKPNRSRSACGNATCGTFQHFTIAPLSRKVETFALTLGVLRSTSTQPNPPYRQAGRCDSAFAQDPFHAVRTPTPNSQRTWP